MENLVEEIHKEFDESYLNLINYLDEKDKILKKTKHKLKENVEFNTYKKLSSFPNSKSVQSIKRLIHEEEDIGRRKKEIKRYKYAVQLHQSTLPFHKFLDISSLYKVLDKYNLYLGPDAFYTGNIPVKNAQEIIEFDKILKDKDFKDCVDGRRTNLPAFFIAPQSLKEKQYMGYYIVAPRDDFRKKDVVEIENELILGEKDSLIRSIKQKMKENRRMRVEDPIVLMPICWFGQLLFTIVTKWGSEANYTEFQNSIEN